MNSTKHPWRVGAMLACAAALAGPALTAAPAMAGGKTKVSHCPNKTVSISAEDEEGTKETLQVMATHISIEGGVSCKVAYKLIAAAGDGTAPKGYHLEDVEFTGGKTGEVLERGAKKVFFAFR